VAVNCESIERSVELLLREFRSMRTVDEAAPGICTFCLHTREQHGRRRCNVVYEGDAYCGCEGYTED